MLKKNLFYAATYRPVITVSVLALLTAAIVAYQVVSIVDGTRRATALEAAISYSRAISSIRNYYSSVVVPRARAAGTKVTHEYHDLDGAIPLPATLTIELGESVSRTSSGGDFRLLSSYPFPWRTEGGAQDNFESAALTAVEGGQAEDFVQVVDHDGQAELRYAQAVRMKASCVACHNSYPESPRIDWKVGDVRGIQSVRVPLPDFLGTSGGASNTSSILEQFAAIIAVLLAALALIGSLLYGMKILVTRQNRLIKIAQKRNRKLAAAKVEAESANRMKSDFLTNMSHELRTPLNAVIGFSDAIRNNIAGPIGDPQYTEYAQHINESGNQLLTIIEGILDLTKIESGELQLPDEQIDIAATVIQCLAMLEDEATRKTVRVQFDPHSDLPSLRANQRAIRQVLHNLVDNAIKFTPAGGNVTISAQLAADGALQITVLDTGLGMSSEEIEIAKKPFAQVDGGLNRKFEGTGMGLHICNKFVELHGGHLTIESAPGAGTSVTIILPSERLRTDVDAAA
ncbi:MAG: ATP-binding protein [Alphaproteobacteria bacterium]